MTLLGENFGPDAAVLVGEAPVQDLVVVSWTELRFTTPPGARGKADVKVTSSGETGILSEGFHYYAEYLRGDANADTKLDIADPVFILLYLFLGGEDPPCAEVPDTNSDGATNISDAVYLLNYLFLGGQDMLPVEARCY